MCEKCGKCVKITIRVVGSSSRRVGQRKLYLFFVSLYFYFFYSSNPEQILTESGGILAKC
uniref:Uncharacterized protein n=1 Tax=Theileria parva TaxID=5875 RepID=Q4N4L7_THEPA|eukprot:XP_765189.1 hypothetical protein [Theileria parva strain Muguga]